MPYIPTVPFRQLISPSNCIGPSQPPPDTILPLFAPQITTTGIMTSSLPNFSASNIQQQQRLLLPPPSLTFPIQHHPEPFTTPPSTFLNPSAANFEGQADLRVASPIDEGRNSPMDEDRYFPMDEDSNPLVDEDRHSPMDEERHAFANELVKTLNTAFTGAPQDTINPLTLHDFPNDVDLNDLATHSESRFIESTLMGLTFLNLDDNQWDGDDSDESPDRRNPQGMLLDYMEYVVICDFMYILDNHIPLETSNEASKRPVQNRSFTSSSLSSDDVDSSLSSDDASDDVDSKKTQPSGARNLSAGSLRKVPPSIPRPTRGNAPSNKRNRPPSPQVLGSKENPIDVEKVGSLFEPIVIREYVWENILQFAYADNLL